jgi:hypothetical protein
MKNWPKIKIILVSIASAGAIFDSSYSDVGNKIGWEPAIVGLVFFPCIVIVGLLVLKVVLKRKLDFQPPGWGTNPLNFSHPEHFTHFAGVIFLASGLCGLISTYYLTGELIPVMFAPIAMGVGLLAGIRVLKLVYTAQEESSNKV